MAGAELLFAFPSLLLQVGQSAPHLLPLFLQAVALIDVAAHVRLCAVLAQLPFHCPRGPWNKIISDIYRDIYPKTEKCALHCAAVPLTAVDAAFHQRAPWCRKVTQELKCFLICFFCFIY